MWKEVLCCLKTITAIFLLPAYLAYALAQKLETARSSPTLVNLYHYTECHIPSIQKYLSDIYCNFRSTLKTLMHSGKIFSAYFLLQVSICMRFSGTYIFKIMTSK